MNNLAIAQIEPVTALPSAMVNRLALVAALKACCVTVERKNTIPILSHVHIKANGDKLEIVGTDLDMTTKVIVPGVTDADFNVTLPAHSLFKLVEKAACETVTFTVQELAWTENLEYPATDHSEAYKLPKTREGKVLIDLGAAQLTLNSMPSDDFPAMKLSFETPAECSVFSLAAPVMIEAFSKCSYAMSTEETRYYLQGIYLHYHRSDLMGLSGLMAVATDGHQLVARSIACLVPTNMPGVIIPTKTILNLIKLLAKSKELVKVAVSSRFIRFAFCDTVIMSKLIDGTYPDYERCIPRNNESRWEIDAKALCAAVEQVLPVSRERGRAIKLELENGTARLTVNNPDHGNCTTAIPVQNLSGHDSFTVGLNALYLLNAAKWSSGMIEFQLADGGSPVLVRDPSDARGLSVVMPMRV